MPFTKLLPTSIDLAQNFTFTGNVVGAGGGKILQEVRATFGQFTDNTTSFKQYATASITPTSSSSSIIVEYYCPTHKNASDTGSYISDLRVKRGGSGGTNIYTMYDAILYTQSQGCRELAYFNYKDSPSTTSSTEYYCEGKLVSTSAIDINWNGKGLMILTEIGA
jgi:hypothetical protein